MFAQLRENVETIIDEITPLIVAKMNQSGAEIIDMNTEQLSKGQLDNGSLITPDLANDEYAKLKKQTGGKAPKGTPDLKNTGDFYSAFYTKEDKEGLLISSSDEKTDKLEKKYSNIRSPKEGQIFGLNDENKTKIANELTPEINEEITTIFLRGFA